MFRFVSLCAILAVFSPVAQSAPIDVYVLAGQSNAFGLARWSELPAADRVTAPGSLYYRPYDGGGFGAVRPIGGKFGPEIGFTQAYYERSGRMPAIVKHAIGGTTLAEDWNAATGPLLGELVEAVETAMDAWTLQGYHPHLRGILWMQGEHDARDRVMAEAYEDNLRAFSRAARVALGRKELTFVAGRIAVPNHPYRDLVRDAQASVRGVKMIDTDGIHLRSDMVHYDSAGQLALGRLFAEQFFDKIPAKSLTYQSLAVDRFHAVPEPPTFPLFALALIFIGTLFMIASAVRRKR